MFRNVVGILRKHSRTLIVFLHWWHGMIVLLAAREGCPGTIMSDAVVYMISEVCV